MGKEKIIYGIQQVGIGVSDAEAAFRWYGQVLKADLLLFDDRKLATHMARYMGGHPHEKRALLAMQANGGSGYEIWQYQDRTPTGPAQPPEIGDLGINYITIKTHDLPAARQHLQQAGVAFRTDIPSAEEEATCFFQDPYGNLLELRESDSWFTKTDGPLGGICGVAIGVSEIERSLKLYADILGYSQIAEDTLIGEDQQIRRVRLRMPQPQQGGFSPLLGSSELVLLQSLKREPVKIFADRYWGDLGYIHVCFDTRHIGALMDECAAKGYPFRVKSEETFEMGDTNGRWGYLEDDDGTLIEFVEAQRVPLIKALNIGIDMRKRDPHQPLPRWLIKALRLKRVRF
jgi:catechol 2,3-dioxygenase-like lactoylglutathione lyase family enzyme